MLHSFLAPFCEHLTHSSLSHPHTLYTQKLNQKSNHSPFPSLHRELHIHYPPIFSISNNETYVYYLEKQYFIMSYIYWRDKKEQIRSVGWQMDGQDERWLKETLQLEE